MFARSTPGAPVLSIAAPVARRLLRLLRAVVPVAAGVATGLAAGGVPASAQSFDLLIRNGRILDGSGNPWYAADVGVTDGRIVAVGQLPDAAATRVIDAAGRYVAPGFIDIHSHADDGSATPEWGTPHIRTDELRRKAMPNVVAMGVTTAVVNHDGRSPWPILEQRATIERQGVGANVMLMAGHGEIRGQVMGDDYRRAATAEEIDRMRALARQAIAEGAVGISAGLEYSPGRWSTTDEVAAIVGELASIDGVYISHERSEGADPMWYLPSQHPSGAPTLIDAVQETIEIGRRTGVKVVASHIKAKGAHWWGTSGTIIQLIERARAEGVRVWADQYPYPTSGSDGSTTLIPAWATQDEEAESREDARPEATMLEISMRDAATAELVRMDVAHEIRRRGGADRVVVFEYPDSSVIGLSLQEVTELWRLPSAVDAAIELQYRGDPDRRGGGRLRGFSMSEDDVDAYAARPWVATASDGGLATPDDDRSVHPRFYGTFPRKIAWFARDRGILSVENAVRSMTSLPALLMGLEDRGEIREGYVADLVVFDLDRIQDEATFFEPHQYPSGIDHVIVGGEFVIDGGEHTWALPGRVLTRF